jgi:1-acyl-sn-glycerol-3-phosphate acyltransferase
MLLFVRFCGLKIRIYITETFHSNKQKRMNEKKKKLEPVDFKEIIRSQENKTVRNLPNFVINIVKRILKEKQLNKFIEANGDKFNVDFVKGAHEYFNVDVEGYGLEQLDPNGRYIFACNHPIGGFDFSSAIYLLSDKFPEIKVIANKVLTGLMNIREMLLPVGVFEKTDKEAREKIDRIMSDGEQQILTFPAGRVARKTDGEIQDLSWHRSFIRQAVQYEREVVPVYIDSFNSKFFYNIGRLRSLLGIKANIELFFIIGEQFKKRNATIPVYFGKPIHYSTFTDKKSHLEWAQEVRKITCNLSKDKA